MKQLAITAVSCWLTHGAMAADWAFFYALDQDLAELKKNGQEARRPVSEAGRTLHAIQIGGHKVHAVKMESGCVCSALSAQLLLSKVSIDHVISVGPVGALHDGVKQGAWVRITRITAYQHGSFFPQAFSWPRVPPF